MARGCLLNLWINEGERALFSRAKPDRHALKTRLMNARLPRVSGIDD
jgi:hypothetical protein